MFMPHFEYCMAVWRTVFNVSSCHVQTESSLLIMTPERRREREGEIQIEKKEELTVSLEGRRSSMGVSLCTLLAIHLY